MRTTGYYEPQMSCWCERTDHAADTDFYRVHQVVQPLNLNEKLLCNSERSLCLLGLHLTTDSKINTEKTKNAPFFVLIMAFKLSIS